MHPAPGPYNPASGPGSYSRPSEPRYYLPPPSYYYHHYASWGPLNGSWYLLLSHHYHPSQPVAAYPPPPALQAPPPPETQQQPQINSDAQIPASSSCSTSPAYSSMTTTHTGTTHTSYPTIDNIPDTKTPGITGWFASLNQHEACKKEDIKFMPFGQITFNQNFHYLSQLSPHHWTVPQLSELMNTTKGAAAFVRHHAEQDLKALL
ncbi:hypothetical protein PAXRUDRAFT_141509 [Paxillus rubicundulus Ve08.2h10]|uniref:Unplaced genomic scaffold scaffold_242, whole genome shotgun sequence n=1 Tax=Paxillus rubicundulus Ve08.2h10 TaxID=930991 RepID=A0A0D0DY36_9AGAM|nr:hypothetical protein PAXRUDRAFT_141509 [Paxillus rubicundulus Ve08.2h10]